MAKIQNDYLLKNLFELSVANFYSYDAKSGLEYYAGTLESHELSKSMDSEEIKGGQDNATLATIDKNTTITLKIVDVCARQDIQALKLGGAIKDVEASDNVFLTHMPKNYDVVEEASELVFELDYEPAPGEEVAIYDNADGKLMTITTDYEITGKKVKIVKDSIKKGDTVFVTGFKYVAPEGTKFFDIKEGSVPAMSTVIEVPLYDEDTQIVAYKQYYFPRTRMNASVTMSGQTEKTKNTDETTIDILKDKSVNYLGRVSYRFL